MTGSRLGRWMAQRVAAHGSRSGFRLLATGRDAFVARVGLIEVSPRWMPKMPGRT